MSSARFSRKSIEGVPDSIMERLWMHFASEAFYVSEKKGGSHVRFAFL